MGCLQTCCNLWREWRPVLVRTSGLPPPTLSLESRNTSWRKVAGATATTSV